MLAPISIEDPDDSLCHAGHISGGDYLYLDCCSRACFDFLLCELLVKGGEDGLGLISEYDKDRIICVKHQYFWETERENENSRINQESNQSPFSSSSSSSSVWCDCEFWKSTTGRLLGGLWAVLEGAGEFLEAGISDGVRTVQESELSSRGYRYNRHRGWGKTKKKRAVMWRGRTLGNDRDDLTLISPISRIEKFDRMNNDNERVKAAVSSCAAALRFQLFDSLYEVIKTCREVTRCVVNGKRQESTKEEEMGGVVSSCYSSSSRPCDNSTLLAFVMDDVFMQKVNPHCAPWNNGVEIRTKENHQQGNKRPGSGLFSFERRYICFCRDLLGETSPSCSYSDHDNRSSGSSSSESSACCIPALCSLKTLTSIACDCLSEVITQIALMVFIGVRVCQLEKKTRDCAPVSGREKSYRGKLGAGGSLELAEEAIETLNDMIHVQRSKLEHSLNFNPNEEEEDNARDNDEAKPNKIDENGSINSATESSAMINTETAISSLEEGCSHMDALLKALRRDVQDIRVGGAKSEVGVEALLQSRAFSQIHMSIGEIMEDYKALTSILATQRDAKLAKKNSNATQKMPVSLKSDAKCLYEEASGVDEDVVYGSVGGQGGDTDDMGEASISPQTEYLGTVEFESIGMYSVTDGSSTNDVYGEQESVVIDANGSKTNEVKVTQKSLVRELKSVLNISDPCALADESKEAENDEAERRKELEMLSNLLKHQDEIGVVFTKEYESDKSIILPKMMKNEGEEGHQAEDEEANEGISKRENVSRTLSALLSKSGPWM
eukprot:Nk52_evm25s24 gene=Nk52_evmTU25s24